jgi:hypothetical protein
MKKFVLFITVGLFFLPSLVLGQDEFKTYTYYQISDAWYISSVDTVNVSEDFSSDYFFIFFIEDHEGQNYFTIRGYEHNEVFCIGEIELELVEEEDSYKAIIYSSDIYFNTDSSESVKRIILETIPNSKEESGYDFYYLWMVINDNEALVFQCFDINP